MGCLFGKPATILGGKDVHRHRRWSTEKRDGNDEAGVTRRVGCSRRPSTASPDSRWSPVPSFMASPLEWPPWLSSVAGEALVGWVPRRADSFQRLSKIGQGTYSNVYKAKDLMTGKTVALKKVRFDNNEPESIKFMAREITLLRRLDHPNVIKIEGLVTSRVSCSLYLIFEYMEHDLSGLAASPDIEFTLPQVKCYIKQLLSGLEHCHSLGVLHRDIKGSNLLVDNQGVLKIADFGLASTFDPEQKRPMTSRVVTLWYRPPELILGVTRYGPSVDLWSAGCILAELLAKKPVLPGRTEVEQLHKIFKLCGSPSDEYWKKLKVPQAKVFKTEQHYESSIAETFKDFPASCLTLVKTLLSIDPSGRGTAKDALSSEFFTTEPFACETESLPSYPPSKEMDARQRDEESRRKTTMSRRRTGESRKKTNSSIRSGRAVPAPQANAELHSNLRRLRQMARANPTSKSDKFPPPHQDGALGFPLENASFDGPASFAMPDSSSFASSFFEEQREPKLRRAGHRIAPSHLSNSSRKKPPTYWRRPSKGKAFQKRERGKEIEVFRGGGV